MIAIFKIVTLDLLMLRLLFFCSLFAPLCLFSDVNKDIGYRNYPNYYFVETGLLHGVGIVTAIRTGNFQEIHSIEIRSELIPGARKRIDEALRAYKSDTPVYLHHGDSKFDLWEVIEPMDRPITFFLDAHFGDKKKRDVDQRMPILLELDQIQKHPIKTHTILIDDIDIFDSWHSDFVTVAEIKEKLYEINPDYEITFIPANDKKRGNNVLLAKIPDIPFANHE